MMKMKGERRRSRKSMASHTGNEPSLRRVPRVQHQGRAVSIPSTRMRFGFALLRRKSAVKSHLLGRQQESKQPSNHQSAQSTESKHRLASGTVYRPLDSVYRAQGKVCRPQGTVHLASDTVHLASDTVYRQPDTVYRLSDTVYLASDTVYRQPDTVYRLSDTVHLASDTVYHPQDTVYRLPDTAYRQQGGYAEYHSRSVGWLVGRLIG